MKNGFTLIVLALFMQQLNSQHLFNISVQPSAITNAPAVHSGAYGNYNGKWFFIGGRTNGLHGFEPPFAFPTNKVNDVIYVVDPHTNQSWSASTYTLADSIREAITSTNMEFYLNDSILYMIGGYGWKDAIQNFITWPTLTAINIKQLIPAIAGNQAIAPYFRQIMDTTFAICGAHLDKLDSTYYLVFGHRFDGTYNRTDSGGFFQQTYSCEIRKFQIADNGTNLSTFNYRAIRDTDNFRRRDFNLVHIQDIYRGDALLAMSGVFQRNRNLPYLNCIEIFPDSVWIRNDFNQNLSQYHSAVCPMFDSAVFLQHDIYFGGMSMYYIDSGTQAQAQDTLVPFVSTISDVARDLDFQYHEFLAPVKMPALLGTNAYFFLDDSCPLIYKHYVDIDHAGPNRRVGYIVGGILSPEPNISLTDASVSTANPVVYEVYISDPTVDIQPMTPVTNSVLNFFCYPNPATESFTAEFELKTAQPLKIELLDAEGRLVKLIAEKTFAAGKQQLVIDISQFAAGIYNCAITANGTRKALRLVKR